MSMTVSQLKAALAALPPEYDDVEVSLNSEYRAIAIEPIDRGREDVTTVFGQPLTIPRYQVDINGY